MYIQLTTRCNMKCAHCGFSCTNKGEDMEWDTFVKAFEYGDGYITLGGGEPTLWKHYDRMIEYLESYMYEKSLYIEEILMVTNGSKFRKTMKLINLAQTSQDFGGPCVSVTISDDVFHDDKKQNQKLIEYVDNYITQYNEMNKYNYHNKPVPIVSYRRVNKIAGSGRALESKSLSHIKLYDFCMCEDMFVAPGGTIYQCGCEDSPMIGYVGDCFDNYEHGCYKDIESETGESYEYPPEAV